MMSVRLDRIELLLAQIAGKNDLSGCTTPEAVIADAQQALWECELLAREALEEVRALMVEKKRRNSEGLRGVLYAGIRR